MQTYSGQCHCGAVKFTATTDLSSMGDCNCSRCSRLGSVLQPVPATQFTLLSGEDVLTSYRFNTNAIDHLFCKVCGVQSFSRGQDRQDNPMVMINVNCLDDVPPVDRATITHWDGKNF